MGNFYTDVIQHDPRFHDPGRCSDIALLEPVTRAVALDICRASSQAGKPLIIYETYRSQERQELLYTHGATRLQHVGCHHFGVAADLVLSINGTPSWKGDYSFLGALIKLHGFVWGGDWGLKPGTIHFVDGDHLQRVTLAEQRALFAGTWYPPEE